MVAVFAAWNWSLRPGPRFRLYYVCMMHYEISNKLNFVDAKID